MISKKGEFRVTDTIDGNEMLNRFFSLNFMYNCDALTSFTSVTSERREKMPIFELLKVSPAECRNDAVLPEADISNCCDASNARCRQVGK